MRRRVSPLPFFFISGNLALDFANTLVGGVDRLEGRLRAWLRAAGLPEGRGRGGGDLRDAIRAAAGSLAESREPPRDAVLAIDRVLRRYAGSFRLRGRGRDLRLTFEPRRRNALAAIAEAAARLLSGQERSRVRRCGNPACTLFFLDTTRNRRRRWCRMEICGNRSKVASWRARRAAPRRSRA